MSIPKGTRVKVLNATNPVGKHLIGKTVTVVIQKVSKTGKPIDCYMVYYKGSLFAPFAACDLEIINGHSAATFNAGPL